LRMAWIVSGPVPPSASSMASGCVPNVPET
jgi:hypothetical protein